MVLVQHHVKYKEIHGEDVTVIMEMSDHVKLHQKLRQEGRYTIPAGELAKISAQARRRSPLGKQKQLEYQQEYAFEKDGCVYNW